MKKSVLIVTEFHFRGRHARFIALYWQLFLILRLQIQFYITARNHWHMSEIAVRRPPYLSRFIAPVVSSVSVCLYILYQLDIVYIYIILRHVCSVKEHSNAYLESTEKDLLIPIF